MAVHAGGQAPYASTKAIVDVVERHRNGQLPMPVTLQVLHRIRVTESLAPRTLQALRLLDFIDDGGRFTPEFEDLRKVPTPEYKTRLGELLRAAYADVFAIVDPSGSDYQQVHDAFRGMKPAGQMNRMTSLFLGLLEYAEWDELPRPSATPRSPTTTRPPRTNNGAPQHARQGGTPSTAAGSPRSSGVDQLLTRPSSGGDTQTIELRSGGSVTFTADVSVVTLSREDRQFVFDIIDRLQAYSAGVTPSTDAPE
jgi:hypothetical protein